MSVGKAEGSSEEAQSQPGDTARPFDDGHGQAEGL